MTAAPISPEPVAPPAEPKAIRACLTPDVAAVFDQEWAYTLDEAKTTQDLAPIHDLLAKWRHFAYGELVEPGRYFRLLAVAARTMATGQPPEGSISGEEMLAELRQRLGR